MKRPLAIFKIKPEERTAAIVAAIAIAAINALFVYKMYGTLTPLYKPLAMQRHMLSHFHVSGYDPLTLITISSWVDIYNTQRHPMLAFLIGPFSILNGWLAQLTGINCALFITAVIMTVCAFYSFIFLRRTLYEVIGLKAADANLLSALFFSFAYFMVICFAPDHFGFSQCMLLIVLYIAGMRIKKKKIIPTWQMAALFIFSTGITTTNCIKAVLMQLFVNGRRFFTLRNILLGIAVPAVALWMFYLFQYKTFAAPIDRARHEARIKRQAAQKAQEEKTKKLYAEADSATKAKMEAKTKKKQVVNKNGRPISTDGMMRWSDITTPRLETIVENMFGESLQFHRQHFLGDVLRSRPVFVKYDMPMNYIIEALVALLFIGGIICGAGNRLMWLVMSWFGFDMALHLGLGFGINEIYIMSPHWLFIIPVAIAFMFSRARGKALAACRVATGVATVWMLGYNGWLLVEYLLTPAI